MTTRTPASVHRREPVEFAVQDASVACYADGEGMLPTLSPRPFLEATTLFHVAVTELLADDHAHHYGVSAALPDVDGVSFWGGRTYVRDVGSTMLDNHGVQRVRDRVVEADRLTEELAWLRPDGSTILDETRTLDFSACEGGWRLDWKSVLRTGASPVSFGSPQTNGRPGAFYGGIFWRTPFASASAMTADGEGTDIAHGSHSPWLAIVTDTASLVAWTRPDFPWFVRTDGYVGFCPAVAVETCRQLDARAELTLELRVAVCDGRLGRADIERIAADLAVAQAGTRT